MLLLSDVEKVREAKSAAGGDGHRRGYRVTREAVHCAGRKRDDARDVAILALECEAWRRATRHGKFCP